MDSIKVSQYRMAIKALMNYGFTTKDIADVLKIKEGRIRALERTIEWEVGSDGSN